MVLSVYRPYQQNQWKDSLSIINQPGSIIKQTMKQMTGVCQAVSQRT